MHEYDVTLKLLLKGPAKVTMRELTGGLIGKWLDIELPKVQNTRVDLLGETADGKLIHLELQSTNDPSMPLRMAEYALGVYRQFKTFPRQILLYVGEPELRMETRLVSPSFAFDYELIDIRSLDGDRLLASEELGDNVLAILTRLRDKRSAVREIVRRMAGLETESREFYFKVLLILAGLRALEEVVEEESKNMPILNDILDHKVIGREFKRGLAEGEQRGQQLGLEEGQRRGQQEEAVKVLRHLIEMRFGALPEWAEHSFSNRPLAEVENLIFRSTNTPSLEDLLK